MSPIPDCSLIGCGTRVLDSENAKKVKKYNNKNGGLGTVIHVNLLSLILPKLGRFGTFSGNKSTAKNRTGAGAAAVFNKSKLLTKSKTLV